MLNNNGASIESSGTPNMISCHELYVSDIIIFYFFARC